MSNINQEQESFLAEFNWHNYAEGIDAIDASNLQEFEDLVSKTFISTSDEEVVEGVVVRITDRDVIVDINAKSEGVISLNEFRYNPSLKVGDKVEVLIDIREDKTGQLVLSHKKARTIKAWDRVISANETGEIGYSLIGNQLKLIDGEYIDLGEITKLNNDTLQIKWKATELVIDYVVWKN